ncbi:hypothetical protein APSETT444_005881 [Aspergillus pseudonomiae]
MPAMAPPDKDGEEELGLNEEVVTAVVLLGVDIEVEGVEGVEDVEVAGSNDCGSKAQVVADGASALKEDIVSLSSAHEHKHWGADIANY